MVTDWVSRPYLEKRAKEDKILLYGRRKTGKTSLVRRVRDGLYVIVTRDGKFYLPLKGVIYDWSQFRILFESTNDIIIDEFHRAPEEFFLHIQSGNCPERIALVTSTMHYFRKFIEGKDSPLVGLFPTIKVPLLEPINLIKSLEPKDKEEFERLIFYQEPILIGLGIREIIIEAMDRVLGLISEALIEEEIKIRERLLAILESIAVGDNTPTEIANYLFAKRLVDKNAPAYVMKYINILVKTGFIRRVETLDSKKVFYEHISPLTHLAFYLEGKYNFYDASLPIEFGERVLRNIISFYVERFMERFFSELYGLKPIKILNPEIDIALTRFNKLYLIGEVKWRESINQKMLREIEEKFYELEKKYEEIERKILIVPYEENIKGETELEIWDLERIKREAKRYKRD